jgi:hypothetical protein
MHPFRSISFRCFPRVEFLVLLFIILPTFGQSVFAQRGRVYFVSTTGDDANPGTRRTPWLTIQHAANSVSAGATRLCFRGSVQRGR